MSVNFLLSVADICVNKFFAFCVGKIFLEEGVEVGEGGGVVVAAAGCVFSEFLCLYVE